MDVGIVNLKIPQGSTFVKTFLFLNEVPVTATTETQSILPGQLTLNIAEGGVGAVEAGYYVLLGNFRYKVEEGIEDLSLGGTITLETPIKENLPPRSHALKLFKPKDFTSFTARGGLSPVSSRVKVADFECSFGEPGELIVKLPYTESSKLEAPGTTFSKVSKFNYEVEILDSLEQPFRVLNGIAEVSPRISDE